MNDFRQQAIILFALMGFLSAAVIFFVTASHDSNQAPATNNSQNKSLLDNVEINEPEGDGLFAQSVKGLIALNKDFNTGLNVVSGETDKAE